MKTQEPKNETIDRLFTNPPLKRKPSTLEKANIIVPILLTILTAVQVYVIYHQTERHFSQNNIPKMLFSYFDKTDSTSKVILWNSGPGIAYDISVEVHLDDNIGNIGCPWVNQVVEAAMQLETKDSTNFGYYLYGSGGDNYLKSPPPIICPGIENGYSTKFYKSNPLIALIVIIKYADVKGNRYIALWKGFRNSMTYFKAKNGTNTDKFISIDQLYKNVYLKKKIVNTPQQFLYYLVEYNKDYDFINKMENRLKPSAKSERDLNLRRYRYWLEKEAKFLEKIGYQGIVASLDSLSDN
jgi:hypothetical protein